MAITGDNYQLAYDAIRDILFMYVDMAESYKGFGHNIDTGCFSPLEFVDAPIYEPKDSTFGIDISLLQSGSAIALLCDLSDVWDEFGTLDVTSHSSILKTKGAYEIGRFSHLSQIQQAFSLGFGLDEEAFREQLSVVYRTYVCSYFSDLAKSC